MPEGAKVPTAPATIIARSTMIDLSFFVPLGVEKSV
jgi:hypothetical protein